MVFNYEEPDEVEIVHRELDEDDDDVGRVTVRDNGHRTHPQLILTIPNAAAGADAIDTGDEVLVGVVDEGEALRVEPAPADDE